MSRDLLRRLDRLYGRPQDGEVVSESGGRTSQSKLKAADLVDPDFNPFRCALLTKAQAAVYLGYETVKAVERAIENGTIPEYCVSRQFGGTKLVRQALDEHLELKQRIDLARQFGAVHGPSVTEGTHGR